MINFNEEHLRNAQERVNSLLSSLPNAAILYLLGVVDAPCPGQIVSFTTNGKLYKGKVKSVELIEGIAVVSYMRTVKRYKKENGSDDDSQSWKNSNYCVPFDVEEETSDRIEFRYLDF